MNFKSADIIIRKANFDDAPEIANVHLNSLREAYRGLLPQEYLAINAKLYLLQKHQKALLVLLDILIQEKSL